MASNGLPEELLAGWHAAVWGPDAQDRKESQRFTDSWRYQGSDGCFTNENSGGTRVPIVISLMIHINLPVITGYKWDYTFYKWGYKYL